MRSVFSIASTLFFASFHHIPKSYMLPNKRNMLLETIGLMFLTPHDDVSQPHCLTFESNMHTFGHWRMKQREFNVEQACCLEDNADIKLNAMFECNLVISRSNSSFKGYQHAFRIIESR